MTAITGAQPAKTPGMALARLARRVAGRMEQGFYSVNKGIGLRRDLARPLERPRAKIPLDIRPLVAADLDVLLPLHGDIPPPEAQQIRWRRHFLKKAPGDCYVAVDLRDGRPCYMQWLIGARDNGGLAPFRCFPRLGDDEALMEQAYTIPTHRGLGVMSAAMARIAERAAHFGARYVLTFVPEDGTASLKACQRAGFSPHLRHRRVQVGYGTVVLNRFIPK